METRGPRWRRRCHAVACRAVLVADPASRTCPRGSSGPDRDCGAAVSERRLRQRYRFSPTRPARRNCQHSEPHKIVFRSPLCRYQQIQRPRCRSSTGWTRHGRQLNHDWSLSFRSGHLDITLEAVDVATDRTVWRDQIQVASADSLAMREQVTSAVSG